MMKRFSLLALAAVLFLMAAGGSNIERLDGKWQCDVREMFAYQTIQATAEEIEQSAKLLEPVFSAIIIGFDSKTSMFTMQDIETEAQSVPFTLVSAQNNTFVLKIDGDDAIFRLEKGSKGQEILAFSADGKRENSLVLVRMK